MPRSPYDLSGGGLAELARQEHERQNRIAERMKKDKERKERFGETVSPYEPIGLKYLSEQYK